MKRYDLRSLIFLALCADLGMFSKQLILPAVNALTGLLQVPGGIATGFSLLFLVIGAYSVPGRLNGTLMSLIQSVIALCFGMTGNMGALSVAGYMIPGIVIDLVLYLLKKSAWSPFFASVAASASACLFRNAVVYHFTGILLGQYLLVAVLSGALFGIIAVLVCGRLAPLFQRSYAGNRDA